mmetsp:Transcript_53507/g.167303  ORF Transcript_53507/g.167303 Transcript_53507/m.167303 type:complete len:216 (-) Transcript_53507:573-1220(-)
MGADCEPVNDGSLLSGGRAGLRQPITVWLWTGAKGPPPPPAPASSSYSPGEADLDGRPCAGEVGGPLSLRGVSGGLPQPATRTVYSSKSTLSPGWSCIVSIALLSGDRHARSARSRLRALALSRPTTPIGPGRWLTAAPWPSRHAAPSRGERGAVSTCRRRPTRGPPRGRARSRCEAAGPGTGPRAAGSTGVLRRRLTGSWQQTAALERAAAPHA